MSRLKKPEFLFAVRVFDPGGAAALDFSGRRRKTGNLQKFFKAKSGQAVIGIYGNGMPMRKRLKVLMAQGDNASFGQGAALTALKRNDGIEHKKGEEYVGGDSVPGPGWESVQIPAALQFPVAIGFYLPPETVEGIDPFNLRGIAGR